MVDMPQKYSARASATICGSRVVYFERKTFLLAFVLNAVNFPPQFRLWLILVDCIQEVHPGFLLGFCNDLPAFIPDGLVARSVCSAGRQFEIANTELQSTYDDPELP